VRTQHSSTAGPPHNTGSHLESDIFAGDAQPFTRRVPPSADERTRRLALLRAALAGTALHFEARVRAGGDD